MAFAKFPKNVRNFPDDSPSNKLMPQKHTFQWNSVASDFFDGT